LFVPCPDIRFYHFFFGPLLLRRPIPEPLPADADNHVPDYRVYKEEELEKPIVADSAADAANPKSGSLDRDSKTDDIEAMHPESLVVEPTPLEKMEKEGREIDGLWWKPKNLWIILRYKVPAVLLHGTSGELFAYTLPPPVFGIRPC
jgi:sodium-dependent phosphate transporter